MSPDERRGSAGGRARAAKLSPERRTEIARKASLAAAVAGVVARAPELSAEQVAKLRAIFAPVVSQDFAPVVSQEATRQ